MGLYNGGSSSKKDKLNFNETKEKEILVEKIDAPLYNYNKLFYILYDEIDVYEKLLTEERKKSIAIQNQDINSLRKISIEQNNLLKNRNLIEEKIKFKFNLLESFLEGKKIKKLSDLLDLNIYESYLKKVTEIDQKIRSVIEELKKIVIINQKIIAHNAEFFNQLLNNITHQSVNSFTYNLGNPKNKKLSKSTRPIFLDANC